MAFRWWFRGSSDASRERNVLRTPRDARPAPRARDSSEPDTPESDTPSRAAERRLVDGIRRGDEAAFATLVRDYAPALARFAFDYVQSTDIAHDVVDDVFVWLWEHRETWDVHGTVRSYLFGAVRHRALNARRNAVYRDRWRQRHADDVTAAGLGVPSDDPVRDTDVHELGLVLRRAIDRLAEGRRTAVTLRWLHGMSYAEVATVMGSSVTGVKQQLTRALRDLRALLPDTLR